MRNRVMGFAGGILVGGLVGDTWNAPVFGQLYKAFIGLFRDPEAPLAAALTAILLAFVMGVPRICVP